MPSPPLVVDLSSYRLTDAESQAIFQNEILPADFSSSSPAAVADTAVTRFTRRKLGKPLVVIAVGQTGAGKTHFVPSILEALSTTTTTTTTTTTATATTTLPAIHLIADTYKAYHPQYAALVRSATPHLASPATAPDASRWLAMAAREAVCRRADVVLESACRYPDELARLMALFCAGDYRVEVVIMAVPAALSRLGILSRFYHGPPFGGGAAETAAEAEAEATRPRLGPRLTPVFVHDESYAGLLRTAAYLDQPLQVVDQVVVVRRDNLVAYGWDKRRCHPHVLLPAVAAAVEKERTRPLTEHEARTALDDMDNLSRHEDAKQQLDQIKDLLKPVLGNEPHAGDFPCLVPLKFARRDGDESSSNVLRLGHE